MSETALAKLSRDELVALVLQLATQVEALRAQLEQQARDGRRQAAPFSKGTRVAHPKRPGRKPGRGEFRRREAPKPEELTEPPVAVPVAETACPRCGGELAPERVEDAS